MAESGSNPRPPSPRSPQDAAAAQSSRLPHPSRGGRAALSLHPPTAGAPQASALRRAQHFVRGSGRVLEQRRFAFHFLGGTAADADAVETALMAYRNEDEGFGHGLEPGLRGAETRPQHVLHALRVLDGIHRCGGRRVERVGRCLTTLATADGALPAPVGRPPMVRPRGDLLTTGPVVGLLHRNEVWHAWLFRATDFCWAAVDALYAPGPREVEAAVAFLDGVPDRARAQAAADRLGRRVREQRLAVLDPERLEMWPVPRGVEPGEVRLPYQYAGWPGSVARAWFTDEEMGRALDFLAGSQQQDGGWPLTVRPSTGGRRPAGPQPGDGAAAVERWERRPLLTVEALRTLAAYGRPVD
ncbi:hypothetical protein [Streptomyces sp. NPDC058045]|uniref:hypothetical protein n=1 Tax=Streptomyces sp. NPDC058045 TaxID=3346311 RepID=UPI0036E1467F